MTPGQELRKLLRKWAMLPSNTDRQKAMRGHLSLRMLYLYRRCTKEPIRENGAVIQWINKRVGKTQYDLIEISLE